MTSSLSATRSNQLSYEPKIRHRAKQTRATKKPPDRSPAVCVSFKPACQLGAAKDVVNSANTVFLQEGVCGLPALASWLCRSNECLAWTHSVIGYTALSTPVILDAP
jgi:hypothetical protein